MNLGSIFNRFSRDTDRLQAGATGARRRRRNQASMTAIEPLEDRRLLAFQYVGFTHSNVPPTPSSPQAYEYNFEIFNDTSKPNDSATMYMRNLGIAGQLQFDYGTAFSSLTNLGSGVTGAPAPAGWNWGTSLPAVGGKPATNVEGPVSLVNANSIATNWNTKSDQLETFYLSKVRISCAPGTVDPTFILHVGDSMPLALEVDFSQAIGTSTIIIRSDATETNAGAAPTGALPNGGGGYNLLADQIYVQAALNPKYGNNFRADDLIQIENSVTGGLQARVSNGDFKIIAGATVSGTTDIRTGSGVPPSAFSPYSQYGYGGNGGNIQIDGQILNAGQVNLQTNSVDPRYITTGPSGLISGGGSITLNNAGADGGAINVRTAGFSQHNIFAGTSAGPAADIAIDINQVQGDLTINALPASKATIALHAPRGQVITNSNVDTIGGLTLDASTLNINRPVSTQQGDITLTGSSVSIGSNVSAGTVGIGNLVVTATAGDIKATSAAVVKATGDTIIFTAAGNIKSDSRLEALALNLTASGSIIAVTRTDTVSAKAGGSIFLSDDDGITLNPVMVSGDGDITVNAKGLLTALQVAVAGTGSITLATTAVGLIANDLKTTNGTIKLSAADGDIRAVGDVFVNDANPFSPTQDFVLSADKGNIVMSPDATFTVADQLSFNAPLGRVLTPGRITGVTLTAPGTGYSSPPTVSFSSGSGALVTPTVGDGKVTFIKVMNGGSGYVTAPTVVFANGGTSGSGAVATAQLSGGTVVGITISNGGLGYKTPPTVSFVGGGGSAAEAVASISGVTSLTVTNGGSGYQVPPMVVISSGDGGAAGTVSVDSTGALTGINVSQRGTAFTAPPEVQIVDSSGSGYGASAVANLTGGVTSGVVSTSGSKYGGGTTATVTGGGGTGATGQPLLGITNASVGAITSQGTGYAVGDLLTVVAGTGLQVQITAVSAGGVVTSATVTRGGGNYTPGDILYLSDPALAASGLRLTVSAVTTGGVATAVTVAAGGGGSGFTTKSILNHVGGSGAVLQVQGDTQIGFINVNSGGVGYTSAPTVTINAIDGAGSGASATAFIDLVTGRVTFISVDNPGSGYIHGATVTLSGGSSGGIFIPATTTVFTDSFTTGVTVVRAGSGYTTRASGVSGGSGTGMLLTFNDSNYTAVGYRALESGHNYSSTPSITLSPPASGGTAAVLLGSVELVVDSITIIAPGTAYNPATTTISLVPVASGGGATANAVSVNGIGSITHVNLASPGKGYVAPPTVTIVDRSGSGSGAVAIATTALGVTGFTLTGSGTGYTSAPTVTITGTGSGATAIATVTNGYVTAVTITNPGSGYSGTPTLTFSGGGALTDATGTVTTSYVVTGITLQSSGSAYNASTTDVILAPVGSGATGVANVSGGVVTSIRISDNGSFFSSATPPTVTLVPYGSGALATATISGGTVSGVTVTSPGAGYAVAPVVTFSGGGGSGATGIAEVGGLAQLSAKRLSWTALEQPLDALLNQFSVAKIVLTGAGDLIINRPSSDLTLEGAVTKDGSVRVTAQKLTITGPVTAGDFNSTRTEDISLQATGNDLIIDAAVTAPRSISLQADAGSITSTTPSSAGLVSAKDLVVSALNGASVKTKVESVSGRVTGSGAPLLIDEADDLFVGTPSTGLTANNGPITVIAGGVMSVYRADSGPNGSVKLQAGSNLLQAVAGNAAEVFGGSASLTSTSGRVDLDTDVAKISAFAPTSTITIDSVSALPVTLVDVAAANNVAITSVTPLTATKVGSELNNVTLTTLSGVDSIYAGNIFAPKGVVTLTSLGDVLSADPTSLTPNISATTARVSAVAKVDGIISLRTAVGTLGAQASSDITIRELDNITLGEPTGPTGFKSVISLTGSVDVTAGGTISATDVRAETAKTGIILTSTTDGVQLGSLLTNTTNGKVTVTAFKSITDGDTTLDLSAKTVSLTSNTGSIGAVDDPIELKVDSVSLSAPGSMYVTNDHALVIASLTGGTAGIGAAGPITQSAALNLQSLSVTSNGSPITLDTYNNNFGAFGAKNPGGTVTVKDAFGGLDMLASNVANMTISAAGLVTQSGAITAGVLAITGSGVDPIKLDTQANAIGTFAGSNASAPVGIKDVSGGLDIAFIQGGPVNIIATGGPLTQSGFINSTNLTVTSNGFPITLDTQVNAIDAFAATNPLGTVVVKDSSGDLVLGKSNVGLLSVTASGAVTQSGAITAGNLTIGGNGVGAITLDTQANAIRTFAASNASAPVSVGNADGPLDIAFIHGGVVNITTAGPLTQSGFINATKLSVIGNGTDPIVLNTQTNVIDSFTASNGAGAVSISDSDGNLVIGGITGGLISITGQQTVTQTGPITGAALVATSVAGGVSLINAANSVTAVTGTAATSFAYGNAGSYNAGPITVASVDGYVALSSATGSINIVGDLTAPSQVAISAVNGTFVLVPPAKIISNVLSYETKTTPTYNPADVPTTIVKDGTINKPGQNFTLGAYFTNSNLTVIADSVTITGPVQTIGTAKTITITALTGNVTFVGTGALINDPVLGGTTTVTAAGAISGVATTTISGGTVKLSSVGNTTVPGTVTAKSLQVSTTAGTITLNGAANDADSIKITNGTRDVTFTDKDDLVVESATAGFLALSTGGNLTQTGAIVANAASLTATAGAITLTNVANDVNLLAISNGDRAASFTDKDDIALSTVSAGAVTIRAGGAITQPGAMTVASLDVATTVGGVTLNNAGNTIGLLSAKLTAINAPLTVQNIGKLEIGQVTTKGLITIGTSASGNVRIGALPSPILQTTGAVNFTGVSGGGVVMANGGTIVAPGGVTMPVGKKIQWALTSAADSGTGSLRQLMTTINSLGAASQITVSTPTVINLASALPTATVPLTVNGKSMLTLNGAAAGASANGLVLTKAGGGVTGVTLQNFGQAGVKLTAAASTTISVITVSNSLYGIYASGALSGTSILSSTFNGNTQGAYLAGQGVTFGLDGQGNLLSGTSRTTIGLFVTGNNAGTIIQGNSIYQATTGISINAATGALIGGPGTQYNTISYATTGVYATGTCTGTSVVNTGFGAGVTTQYNTATARNLSVTK